MTESKLNVFRRAVFQKWVARLRRSHTFYGARPVQALRARARPIEIELRSGAWAVISPLSALKRSPSVQVNPFKLTIVRFSAER